MTAKDFAMQCAKEITIAKMNNSAPDSTNTLSGKNIGNMYEAIYKKIYEIASEKPSN